VRRTAALIVGGGPAGSAAAITLAQGGVRPLLLERSRETGDALCGGFLSWRTLDALTRLGIAADELNREPVTRVRLFAANRTRDARLPRPACAVSRHRLDSLLLARAGAEGAAIEHGVMVRSIDGARAITPAGEIVGEALFLASGKHDVRGVARPAAAKGEDPALGLRVRLPAVPALRRLIGDAIELHLFDRGYAGLVRQEDGSANLCMAVQGSRLKEAGDPERLLAALAAESPALGERLAWRDGGAIDAVANVPYGWRARETVPGLFRLGDQAGVIPSLAGEGMGIALASGVLGAQAFLRGGAAAAPAFQRDMARRLARPIGIASAIKALAQSRAAPTLVALTVIAPFLIEIVARATRIRHPDA
jgi:flavin-dependent dehydrogenase